jgi:hypothetical protein
VAQALFPPPQMPHESNTLPLFITPSHPKQAFSSTVLLVGVQSKGFEQKDME